MGRLVTFNRAEGTEHENTLVEGSIASHEFIAGTLKAGKVFRFSCGIVVNDNNGTNEVVPYCRFGTSTTVASNTAMWTGASIDVADADVGAVWGEIHVHSATRAVFIVHGIDGADAIGTIANVTEVREFTLVNPDTASHYLDITLDWDTAHADNEAAASCWYVEEVV